MKGASYYSVRYQWLKRGTADATVDDVGAPSKKATAYTANGYLWGSLEDITSNPTEGAGPVGERRATVRLRQFPAVTSRDRLLEMRNNRTWEIESMYQDWSENETVLDVVSRDSGYP